MTKLLLGLICVPFLIYSTCTLAADFEINLVIKDHHFVPNILEVPAGVRIKINVHNQDDTVEEFESVDLKREKIIPGNTQVKIVLAPLEPGEYQFFGDFHQETAQGVLIVKE